MGGVSDAVFGSSGSGAQIVDTTPKAFKKLADPVAQGIRGILDSGGGPTYEGPLAPTLTPEQLALLGQSYNASQNTASSQASQGYLGNVLSGQFLSPQSNPYLQATIEAAQRPALAAFQEVTMPNIRAQFTNAGQQLQGQGSSPFMETQRQAERDLMNSLSDISTNIAGQNFQAERSRQQEAAALAPQVQRQEVDQLVAGLQAQALPMLIEDLGIERGIAEFNQRINTLLAALQTGVQAASPSTQTIDGTAGSPGLLQGAAQGLGASLGSMFSDRRLKSAIRRVGTHPLGIGVYTYDIGGEPSIGVMADEVAQVMPEAVHVGEDGYQRVHYFMLER